MTQCGKRFYTDEEAERILKMAASKSAMAEGVSRERLLHLASELGISPEALMEAEATVIRTDRERALRTRFQGERWNGSVSHLITYVLVNCLSLIKVVRERTGLGLKDSKELVDRYLAENEQLRA